MAKKRGRKTKDFSINKVNDREEIVDMIINQINSLNKKIKGFQERGIETHYNFVKGLLTDDLVKYNDNGFIAKSKEFYKDKHIIWLKKSYVAIRLINNHYAYGTVNKYQKELDKSMKQVQETVREHLEGKGYSEQFIKETLDSKDFYVALFDEFENLGVGYGSKQAIEKVALTYKESSAIDEKEKKRILSNIEYARNSAIRLKEMQEATNEVIRNRNKR